MLEDAQESMVSKLLEFLAEFLHRSGANKTSGLFIALPGRAEVEVGVGGDSGVNDSITTLTQKHPTTFNSSFCFFVYVCVCKCLDGVLDS